MKLRNLLLLFVLPFFTPLSAQKLFNGDSLFVVARSNAFENNYPLALEQCDTILNRYPEYIDAKLLKARIYSWDKKYESAKALLEIVIAEKPDNIEAYKAITSNALWSDNPQDAIASSEKGLLIDPTNLELLFDKAKAQIALKRYSDAEKTVALINQINPNNQEAEALQKEINLLKKQNTLALYNLHDWFASVYGQRNLLSLEYKRLTSLGPVLGRINYANRFGIDGFQYEADFYPRLSSTLSGYLNYGFSNAPNLFPKHKLGAELFNNFTKKITASLGVRYMVFASNDILTLTGSGGVYTGKYWFGIRAYVTPTKQRTAESIFLFARRFLQNDKNFLTLTLGQGVSPENSTNSLNFNSFYFLKTQNAKLQWVRTFDSQFAFQVGTDFTRLQLPFDAQKHILQFTLDTGIKYQF